jgi:hypothetical protein
MSPYPDLLWAIDALSLNATAIPSAFYDSWISFLSLRPESTIPAIPPAYRREFEDQRAIYVTGIPDDVTPPEMEMFFGAYGDVDKCIIVVDLGSKVTFRWVVMGGKEDVARVLEQVHGRGFSRKERGEPFVLKCCMAVGPDQHVNILEGEENSIMSGIGRYEDVVDGEPGGLQGTHGHPSPVASRVVKGKQAVPAATPKEAEQGIKVSQEELGEFMEEDGEDSWQEHDGESQNDRNVDDPDIPTVVTIPPDGFVTLATSWANIAGTANPNHQVINIAPASKIGAGPRLKPVGRIPSISGPRGGESQVQTIRVVHLLGIPNNLDLQDVSNAVREGALRAIRFGINPEDGSRWAGIVFQHASEAETFWQVITREKAEGKPERFKCAVEAVRGDPFQQDDILRAMGPPTYASRRLTIVKSKFFFMFGEKNLRALCERLVGKENIQLIWLYNGGNATIVFADVESAMVVKEKLDAMAKGKGLVGGQAASTWEGLQTTFSKDPCVAPLELKTAMC